MQRHTAQPFHAWISAAAATVILKQAMARLVTNEAGEAFLEHLRFYTGLPNRQGRWAGILLPFRELLGQTSILAYGSTPVGFALVAAAGLAFLIAARRGWSRRRAPYGRDVLMLLAAALVPLAWVLFVPMHTYQHAWLMVRILVVPISLAPLALFWPEPRGRSQAMRPGAD